LGGLGNSGVGGEIFQDGAPNDFPYRESCVNRSMSPPQGGGLYIYIPALIILKQKRLFYVLALYDIIRYRTRMINHPNILLLTPIHLITRSYSSRDRDQR